MIKAKKLIRTLALAALPAFFAVSGCWAGPLFYVDAGGGYVQMRNSASFFNQSGSGTGSGYGLGLGFFSTLTTRDPVMNFQLGIQDRYETTSNAGATDGLNLPYAAVRLQLSRIFFTFGYCPYVWQSIGGASAQSATLSHVSAAYSLLGEAGFLLPVTPRFSFYLSGAYESVSAGGVKSPNPILSGAAGMRFYFGFGAGDSGSNEFHGWRYPFGRELN